MKSKMILPRKFFQGKSILLSILILFWVAYVVSSLTQYWVQSNQYYEGELKRRRDVIDYQLELAQHFLLNGKAGALAVRLQKAREVGEFDFFVLLEDNELVDYFNQGAGPEGLLNIPSTSDFVIGQRITVKAHQIGNYKILLGIFSSREQFLWTQLRAVTVNLVVDSVS